MLDGVGRAATALPDRRRHCAAATVAQLASDLHGEHASRLTVALRESAQAVRQAAETQLGAAGLLVVPESGDWLLQPEAGRYRSADPLPAPVPATAPEALFEE